MISKSAPWVHLCPYTCIYNPLMFHLAGALLLDYQTFFPTLVEHFYHQAYDCLSKYICNPVMFHLASTVLNNTWLEQVY